MQLNTPARLRWILLSVAVGLALAAIIWFLITGKGYVLPSCETASIFFSQTDAEGKQWINCLSRDRIIPVDLQGIYPAISPNRRYLAFQRSDSLTQTTSVFLYDMRVQKQTLIAEDIAFGRFYWLSTTQLLILRWDNVPRSFNDYPVDYSLYDLDKQSLTALDWTNSLFVGYIAGQNEFLLYNNTSGLMGVGKDGNQIDDRSLPNPTDVAPLISISPDVSILAYADTCTSKDTDLSSLCVSLYNRASGGTTKLTTFLDAISERPVDVGIPLVSNNTHYLAFVANNKYLVVYDLVHDTYQVHKSHGRIIDFAWEYSGTTVFFTDTGSADQGKTQIYSYDPVQDVVRQITADNSFYTLGDPTFRSTY